ncbi:MAG: 2,5-diketo-D-gluconic acid reductase [Firmicutes bacterium HGW-Firmicutes-2]|jgi:diketogulonate reductase-like aldo/keto reductase|nr:MAG: 2,5-diketo-D-gluconic acid reductase [Firmicutes bacterium HGW-Firmicutes-2]
MKSLTDYYTLHNGVTIPCVGFGTWQTPNDDVGITSVKTALDVGYRHIDTAAIYGNEVSVGKAMKASGIPREEIFLTSKLWNDDHGYAATYRAFEETMKRLDTDYLDLYLIHWPNPPKFRDKWQEVNSATWKAMEELYEAGKIRAIGVSNFRTHHLKAIMNQAKIVPMVNQIRLCPGDLQEETVDFCRQHNILLEAYSPLGTGKVFDVPEMQFFEKKYGKSIAQICLRWSLERGYLPLPKSVTPSRIEANADIFDFQLEERDVEDIANLTGACGFGGDPDLKTF